MSINPIQITQHLRDTYVRYLQSLNSVSNPEINELYRSSLQQAELIRGPYLEGSLPFVSGGSIAELVQQGILSADFVRMNQQALPGIDRFMHIKLLHFAKQLLIGVT